MPRPALIDFWRHAKSVKEKKFVNKHILSHGLLLELQEDTIQGVENYNAGVSQTAELELISQEV